MQRFSTNHGVVSSKPGGVKHEDVSADTRHLHHCVEACVLHDRRRHHRHSVCHDDRCSSQTRMYTVNNLTPTHRTEDDLRTDHDVCREGALPFWPLNRQRLTQLTHAISSVYASSPGNRTDCYAKLAVSSPAVAETIAGTHCTTHDRGMSRLSGPEWPKIPE